MLKTWKERRLYYFTCQGCAKRRSSLKRSIARAGKCRKCRRNKVPDNQPSLFSTPPKLEPIKVANYTPKTNILKGWIL